MNRRDFILLSGAAAALPMAALAAPMDYRPGLVDELLARGDTVFLDFKASWCSTCKAQEKVLTKLKAENPDYEASITFVNVDWDTYGRSTFAKRLNIPRRSTLVVLHGDGEVGRLVAETREDQIRELLQSALNASAA